MFNSKKTIKIICIVLALLMAGSAISIAITLLS